MILLLSAPGEAALGADPEIAQDVDQRVPTKLDEVLGWVTQEKYERVVVHWPTPGFNPFALARRLRAVDGPALVLTGDLRPETRFWAERNGCGLAADPTTALAARGGDR